MKTKLILIIGFSIIYGLFDIFKSRMQKGKREISESGKNITIRAMILDFPEYLKLHLDEINDLINNKASGKMA
ncbi:MAG: hypothetical protein GX431_02245 [Bacteroidales bacterium]|nr:hypothetical protein [Bacteroidales bacterium]